MRFHSKNLSQSAVSEPTRLSVPFEAMSSALNQNSVPLPASIAKAPGVYPLVVVDPGTGGGVSNTFYLIVNSK